MAALTQHRPHDALAGRRFGSFAGKPADTGSPHNVGVLTQHRPDGAIAGRRYGSFAGKPSSGGGTDWDAAAPIDVRALVGVLSVSADVQFSTVFGLSAPTLALAGVVSASADVSFVTAFDLTAATVTLNGTAAVSADVAYLSTAYTSAGVLYIPVRMVSALWSSTGAGGSGGAVAWLPPARQDMVYFNQRTNSYKCDPSWYRFFEYMAETKLGGKAGPTLPAVVTALTDTQTTSAASTAAVTAVQQQTQANAEALFVTREVVKLNGLTGSEQIPNVELL